MEVAQMPELVPVQLSLPTSRGNVEDWLLWPSTATERELAEFSEGLVKDLGMPQHFQRTVAESIKSQAAAFTAAVPPMPQAAGPRRELIRCATRSLAEQPHNPSRHLPTAAAAAFAAPCVQRPPKPCVPACVQAGPGVGRQRAPARPVLVGRARRLPHARGFRG